MATITHRGDFQYQAVIRRKGYPTQTRTFETKRDAEIWATVTEAAMFGRKFKDTRELKHTTLKMSLQKYREEVTPTKRFSHIEHSRIGRLMQHPLALRDMSDLDASDFSAYRDERKKLVSGSTIRLELAIFSHLYTTAIKEWSWPLSNVLNDIKKPKANEPRERRLEDGEEARLLEAIDRHRCRAPIWLKAAVVLAIESGMRAGELLTLEWRQVDLDIGCVNLELDANGSKRTVGLTHKALAILESLPRPGKRVIPNFHDTAGLDKSFARACEAAKLEDFRFHDLRHEAASQFAEHMTVQELAKVMGWKTLQMAMRYYNPKKTDIVKAVRRKEKAMAGQRGESSNDAHGPMAIVA